MDTKVFKDLYRKVWNTRVKDFPVSSLSSLLHGYLAVYSMVRIYPWLEDNYGSRWKIHERVREIARVLSLLVENASTSTGERVGYVADLMNAYLTYSDMNILDKALDGAYEILRLLEDKDEAVASCRSAEMCRMLCSCYYFMNEEKYVEWAWHIIDGWDEEKNTLSMEERWKRNRAKDLYYNTVGNEKMCESALSFGKIAAGEKSDDFAILTLWFDVLATCEYEKMRLNS